MALTVGINTYLTLAEFKAWADLRSKDYGAYSDSLIESALVISSLDYIDLNYTFLGIKLDYSQPMSLPTDQVSISDISSGAAQAAWQALTDELFISNVAQSNGQVTKQRDKLDVLETETEYAEGTASSYTHNTTQIDLALKPYLANAGGMGRIRNCWND